MTTTTGRMLAETVLTSPLCRRDVIRTNYGNQQRGLVDVSQSDKLPRCSERQESREGGIKHEISTKLAGLKYTDQGVFGRFSGQVFHELRLSLIVPDDVILNNASVGHRKCKSHKPSIAALVRRRQ